MTFHLKYPNKLLRTPLIGHRCTKEIHELHSPDDIWADRSRLVTATVDPCESKSVDSSSDPRSRCHAISTKPACPFITWPALCCDSGSGSRCEIDLSVGAWSCWCNGLWNAAAILWPSAEWQSSAEQRNLLCMWQLLCRLRLVTQHCLRVRAKCFCLFYLFLTLCLFLSSPPFSSLCFHMQSHLSLLCTLK